MSVLRFNEIDKCRKEEISEGGNKINRKKYTTRVEHTTTQAEHFITGIAAIKRVGVE